MIKSYDNYSPPHSYSDYEESLTESIHQSLENDYSYLDFYNESDKELSSEHIKLLSLNHYINHYLTYIVEDELVFFLFQAELFLNLRRYTNSLSACFCFEAFGGSSVVSKCTIQVSALIPDFVNYQQIGFRVIRDRNLPNREETLTVIPTRPFVKFYWDNICVWDYNKRPNHGLGVSIDYNVPRNKVIVNCADNYSDTVNKINSELELLTTRDGNYVNIHQDHHDNYKKGSIGITELYEGSNLEIVNWRDERVYTKRGGEKALRVVFNKKKNGNISFFRQKVILFFKE
uniref:Uncharacterized protein n=1 Tax=Theileria parva TaxID=5875 RepID=Q4N5I2_THEPA|eukprot:XP_764874.1 hypothetical protein [Theileria parva strain Muguga]